MKHKPDDETLVAYLYGELAPPDRARVKSWLEQNPAHARVLDELQFARTLVGQLPEQEVIAPPVASGRPARQMRRLNGAKTALGMAAALLILLAAARLLEAEIQVGGGQLTIRLGAVAGAPAAREAGLSEMDIQHLVGRELTRNNALLQAAWQEEQQRLQEVLRQHLAATDARLATLAATAGEASAAQVEAYVATLQKDNLKRMNDYLRLTAAEQKGYFEGLLTDFSKYVHAQRAQDIGQLSSRLIDLEKNNSQLREETGQILANLLANPEARLNRQVNY